MIGDFPATKSDQIEGLAIDALESIGDGEFKTQNLINIVSVRLSDKWFDEFSDGLVAHTVRKFLKKRAQRGDVQLVVEGSRGRPAVYRKRSPGAALKEERNRLNRELQQFKRHGRHYQRAKDRIVAIEAALYRGMA